MSDFYNNLEQKSTEDIYQYANRLYNSWLEERKSANQRSFFVTEKCFIMTFISGLGNDQVKSKMNKWLKEKSNPEKLEAISLAHDYQSEEDEIYQSDEKQTPNGTEFYSNRENYIQILKSITF